VRDDEHPELTLRDGFASELRLGNIAFSVTHRSEAIEVIERGVGRELVRPATATTGVGLVLAACMGWVSYSALPYGVREGEREQERIELARQYLMRAEEREEAEVFDDAADNKEGGMGTRAKGSEGSMGGRYGVAGPMPRQAALREATEFGMVGLLNSGAGGDADAPTAPWGRDDSLGSASTPGFGGGHGKAQSAKGNMWGDDISHKGVQTFGNYGLNPPTDPVDDPVSTFAIDVDTGSYSIVRRSVRGGQLPPAVAVRAEEMLNYFDYDYARPAGSTPHPFAARIDAAPSPYEQGHLHVRVAVQTKRPSAARRPAHLVYLVDTSGSMQSSDKMPLVKHSLRLLTNTLKPGDTVALCTYAGFVSAVLPPTTIADKQRIVDAIDSLGARGSTAMESGLDIAYRLARRTLVAGDINRVIVVSDGDANVGKTSHAAIIKDIKKYRGQGITLSTIGFGTGNYRDQMMERLANEGDGNYSYVDDAAQARRVFVDGVDGMLNVVARDVKIQVAMDSRYVQSYRLIGYENRDVADKDFRNDKVDGGEIGSGHSVTAVYDVVLKPVVLASATDSWLKLNIRYKQPTGSEKANEVTFELDDANIMNRFDDAPASLRMASAVVGMAEILRESPYAKHWSIDRVVDVARSVPPSHSDRAELLSMTRQVKKLTL
jgi:Ca-activated chloride channel family protein